MTINPKQEVIPPPNPIKAAVARDEALARMVRLDNATFEEAKIVAGKMKRNVTDEILRQKVEEFNKDAAVAKLGMSAMDAMTQFLMKQEKLPEQTGLIVDQETPG